MDRHSPENLQIGKRFSASPPLHPSDVVQEPPPPNRAFANNFKEKVRDEQDYVRTLRNYPHLTEHLLAQVPPHDENTYMDTGEKHLQKAVE